MKWALILFFVDGEAMRLKTRNTWIVAFSASAFILLIAIVNSFRQADAPDLEPSLYAFVLQAELEQIQNAIETRETTALGGGPLPRDAPNCIFLADSYSLDDDHWTAPPKSLIDAIGSESVRSVEELQGDNPIYMLSNVTWVDAHTVMLDKEQIQGDRHTAMRRIKFSRKDGQWRVLADGEYWERDPGGVDAFSHSNSGHPL